MGSTQHDSTTQHRHSESMPKDRLSSNDVSRARATAKIFFGWDESKAARAEQELLDALHSSGGYDSRALKDSPFRSENGDSEPTDAIRHLRSGLVNALKDRDQERPANHRLWQPPAANPDQYTGAFIESEPRGNGLDGRSTSIIDRYAQAVWAETQLTDQSTVRQKEVLFNAGRLQYDPSPDTFASSTPFSDRRIIPLAPTSKRKRTSSTFSSQEGTIKQMRGNLGKDLTDSQSLNQVFEVPELRDLEIILIAIDVDDDNENMKFKQKPVPLITVVN